MSRVIADGLSKKADYKQFGLGGASEDYVLDANNVITSGVYGSSGGNTINMPGSTQSGVLKVSQRTSTIILQEALNVDEYFSRRSTDSGATWSPWVEAYNQSSILGTVSQSAGVPTGAIIERGSNANGEYVKYADGTMECWNHNFLVKPASDSTTGEKETAWDFPIAFTMSDYPVVFGSIRTSAPSSVGAVSIGPGEGYIAISIRYEQKVSNGADIFAYVIAKGRWF